MADPVDGAARIAPKALNQHQPPLGSCLVPGTKGRQRLQKSPEQMPGHHRVEWAWRYRRGVRLNGLYREVFLVRLGPKLAEHPRREVDGGYAVAQLRR
jgi:hypothetical protein